MKIVVCVKYAASLGDDVGFTEAGTAVDPDYLEHALNEWDAYAAEEALRLRDRSGGEVVVISAGDATVEPGIRRCLAMGADRGVRVATDETAGGDVLGVADALAGVVCEEQPDLVLCGMQSSDEANGAVGAALAALVGMPCETCVVGVTVADGAADVRRELEGGLIELRRVLLPAVLTVQAGINEPRYVTFRAIKQADQKELAVVAAPPPRRRSRTLRMRVPERDRHAVMLAGDAREQARQIAAILHERLS